MAQPLPVARWRPVTLDLRDAVVMGVTPEFATAQAVADPEDVPAPRLAPPLNPFLSADKPGENTSP
ncbi:hypothetical protein AYO44_16935 [Planctomycetaceae bacterium SCGC AG-212-F19]|nr:hypothetical protein AYO44_16935 [Planctomycetaceae bacterium SCGC AG-212-F19]